MKEELQYEEEIDLMDLIKTIWKGKKIIVATTVLISLLSLVFAFTQDKVYRANMTFTAESKKSNSLSSMASNLAFLGIGGGGESGELDYSVVMNSRTFVESVVEKLDYLNYLKSVGAIGEDVEESELPTISGMALGLKNMVAIEKDIKTGVYSLSVEINDREMAVKIVESYYENLVEYVKIKKKTKSTQEIDYIEKQIKIIESNMKQQEKELRDIEKKYKTVSIEEEAKAVTVKIVEFKGKLLELNAKLEIASEFSGKESREIRRIKKEIESVEKLILELENGRKGSTVGLLPLNQIVEIKSDVIKLNRELQASVEIYKMLKMQYETAKLERIKEADILSILDSPLLPEYPIKPNKKLMLVIGFILGGFMGIFIVFVKEFLSNIDWSQLKD